MDLQKPFVYVSMEQVWEEIKQQEEVLANMDHHQEHCIMEVTEIKAMVVEEVVEDIMEEVQDIVQEEVVDQV
jgi:archaellum component FlaF (FlaF/FlaG flagellin family)